MNLKHFALNKWRIFKVYFMLMFVYLRSNAVLILNVVLNKILYLYIL